MSSEPAVIVDNVSKRFRMYRERNQTLKAALMRGRRAAYDEFAALTNVSFEIPAGSTFGIIGENGSGKSTILKCIARILVPDTGSVRVNGTLAALLELGSGFHPEMSGRENIYLNGSILGMKKKEIEQKFDQIVDFAGVEQFIDQPVKNYSSGMYVRLGFSIAINVDPDVLLVDEVLAVGDALFQEKCMEKFADFRRSGKTVVIVSHAMGSLRTMCDQAAWLSHGELQEVGPANEIVDDYVDELHVEREEYVDGGSRWGSGEIRITDVQLLDAALKPTLRAFPGDRLTFRIHFDAQEPIERPVFGLALETIEGVYAWAHHSRDGGFVPDVVKGPGYVDLQVPHLNLQANTYQLHASIVDYTVAHTYDFQRAMLKFDVLSRSPHESGGIAVLGGTWGNLQLGGSHEAKVRVARPG